MKNIRVGVVNWDCSLPPETYFGYYQTRTLSPRKFRSATPYYADIINEDKITYHLRTEEEFDRELEYAIKAGIDYFAYVFYPEHGSRNHISLTYSDCSHRVYELNYARRMHMASKLRNRIGMAAIVGAHPFEDEDVRELTELMAEPYYERIDGRPLLYFFGGIRKELGERIRAASALLGLGEPFFVAMYNEDCPEDADYNAVDALSAYGALKFGISSYGELCDEMMQRNRERLAKGRGVIPLYTVGWDPSPRIDIPSPWVSYDNEPYARRASAEELTAGARMLSEWIRSEARDAFVGHILTFAWNEFEEGGWICPTYNDDLTVNEQRVSTFSEISRLWKDELK